MIVTEFQIDRFRDGQPLRVLDLGNGLNVAFVEDRRAQQIMLDVVPSVLYGKPVFHRAAAGSGSLPATIAVRTDNGVFRIRRTEMGESAGTGLSIKSPDGTQHESDFLRTLVDGVGQIRFERMFTLNTTRLWHEIHKRPKRVTRVTRAMRRMAATLRDATPALSNTPSVPHLSAKPLQTVQLTLAELTRVLTEASQREASDCGGASDWSAHRTTELTAELEHVESDIASTERQLAQIEQELDDTELALEGSRVRGRLEYLERALAEAQAPVSAPRATPRSTSDRTREELSERLARCQQRCVELNQQRKGLQRQIADLGRVTQLRTLLPRIEATLMQEKFLLTEEQTIERLADHARELESRLDESRMQAQSRSAEASRQQSLATQALAELDRYAEQFRRTKREYLQVRSRLAKAVPTPAASSVRPPNSVSDGERLFDATYYDDVDMSSDQGGEQTALIRERMRINEDLRELQEDRASLDDLLQRLYADQLVPPRVLFWLGLPFMIGVAMIIYGMFMAGDQTNWRFIGFGFAFTVATSLVKMSLDHMNGGRLAETRKQVDEMDREISTLMERADQLDDQLGATEAARATGARESLHRAPSPRRASEASNAAVAERRRTKAAVATALASPKEDSARLRQQALELRHRYRDMLRRWREFLLASELSPSLSPMQAKEALRRRLESPAESTETPDRALEFQLKQLRNDLERRRSTLAQATTQARSLTQELGFSSSGATIVEHLNVLRESLQDYHEHAKARQELRLVLQKVRGRERRLRDFGRRLDQERKELQRAEHQAARQLQMRQQTRDERVKLLTHERNEWLDRLKHWKQRDGERETILSLVQLSPGELESRRENLATQRNSLRQELPNQYERRGQLREQLHVLERATSRDQKSASQWTELMARAQEAASTCREAARTAGEQLAALRKLRRAPAQARFLQVASDYLRRLTEGNWIVLEVRGDEADVYVSDGKDRAERADSLPDREIFDVVFSLWMAQLDWLAEQRVRLPIVLEDPLGMTSHSPFSAAKVLRDFAATGHQLILTTRVPEHAEWFADLEVPIANFAIRFSDDKLETSPEVEDSKPELRESADVA